MADETNTISITRVAIFHAGKKVFKFNAEILKARCPQLYDLWKQAGYPAECVLNNIDEPTFAIVHKAIVDQNYVWPSAMLSEEIVKLTNFAHKMEMKWLMGYVNDIISREYLIAEDFKNPKDYGNYVLENSHIGMFVKILRPSSYTEQIQEQYNALILKVVGEKAGTVVQTYCIDTEDILVVSPESIEIMTTEETSALRKKLTFKGDAEWVR